MLAVYVLTVPSRVWVHNGQETLRGSRFCCFVVPLSWCAAKWECCNEHYVMKWTNTNRIVLSSVACLTLLKLSTLPHKQHDCRKKKL